MRSLRLVGAFDFYEEIRRLSVKNPGVPLDILSSNDCNENQSSVRWQGVADIPLSE